MSAAESESTEESTIVEAIRTVTPGYRSHEDTEMDVIGWSIFLGLVVLLIPLLPFLLIVWAISKVLERF